MGNKVGPGIPKLEIERSKVGPKSDQESRSGNKKEKSGTKVGPRIPKSKQKRSKVGPKWDQESQSGNKRGTKWEQSGT